MKQRLLRSLSAAFPPDSKRVMAPSGSIVASHTSLPLIVVTSFPRSGTHILIDLILNNFTPYRRNPLYVDLDRYIHEGLDVEDLIQKGGYVVKTHYPEPTFSATKRSDYEKIFSNAIILQPDRNPQIGM